MVKRADDRRNVLLILTDQRRFDTLGCYGAPTCRTPHIDALAAGGMTFTDAHSGAAVCTPTRYGVLTGRYAPRTVLDRADLVTEMREVRHPYSRGIKARRGIEF